jgi:uncharacterized protein with FMN-binding domain
MKKSIVIILAVAIIGILGLSAKGHGSGGKSAQDNPSVQAADTTAASPSVSSDSSGSYKDGTYTGQSEFTPYGTVQVAAVVSGGKITDVKFLRMPGPEGHSKEVTAFAEPYLKDETLQKQSANISFVSGATQTSEAYMQSLQAALDQAA